MVRTFVAGKAGCRALAGGARRPRAGARPRRRRRPRGPAGRGAALTRYAAAAAPIHLEDALTPDGDRAGARRPVRPVAREEIAAGAQLLLSGDMGIGNTTPAAALVAAALGLPATEVTGRGTGVDDAGLARKRAVVDAGAAPRRRPRRATRSRRLTALGSADLAAATGYLARRPPRPAYPVLLDGLMSVACALTADRIAPGAAAWFAAGHRSTEPAQSLALDKLGLEPLLDLGLRLGEGSGAVAAVPCCAAPWRCCATSRCSPTCCRWLTADALAARGRDADRDPGAGAGRRSTGSHGRLGRCCSRRWPCCRSASLVAAVVRLGGLRRRCRPSRSRSSRSALLAAGSRALHWDGLSDVADGLTASYDRGAVAGRDEVRHVRARRRRRRRRGARRPGRRAGGVVAGTWRGGAGCRRAGLRLAVRARGSRCCTAGPGRARRTGSGSGRRHRAGRRDRRGWLVAGRRAGRRGRLVLASARSVVVGAAPWRSWSCWSGRAGGARFGGVTGDVVSARRSSWRLPRRCWLAAG